MEMLTLTALLICGCSGTYQIRIAYCCIEVGSSACFIAKAWDACRVRVADVTMSEVGFESSFKGWIVHLLLSFDFPAENYS